ncbi:MAG: hypothetical protein AAF216_12895 [Pseudomonadota bacterium]
MTKKLVVAPFLLLAACVMCGVYGIAHNQISYTISHEYFHAFKFQQFDSPPDIPARFAVAWVGWYASWWIGLLAGTPIVLASLATRTLMDFTHAFFSAAIIAVTTAAASAGLAVAYGFLFVTSETLPGFWYPDDLANPVAFARAGLMHTFSYLGAFAGLVFGLVSIWFAAKRSNGVTD